MYRAVSRGVADKRAPVVVVRGVLDQVARHAVPHDAVCNRRRVVPHPFAVFVHVALSKHTHACKQPRTPGEGGGTPVRPTTATHIQSLAVQTVQVPPVGLPFQLNTLGREGLKRNLRGFDKYGCTQVHTLARSEIFPTLTNGALRGPASLPACSGRPPPPGTSASSDSAKRRTYPSTHCNP